MANERLIKLRALMEQNGIDMYYVPSSDFHDSEYVEDYFCCRAFLSGFTGSAGTMVVTKDFSGMWTDGRYFVQAKKQLEGQDTELMRIGDEGVPTIEAFIESHMPVNGVLGMDGRVVNSGIGRNFRKILEKKNARIAAGQDLVDQIWEERPALVPPQIWVLKEQYAGESTESKQGRLRDVMKENGASVHILSGLDDIAWLLNIRKTSNDGNLLPPAHVIVTRDSLRLFIDSRNIGEDVRAYFAENGISLAGYEEIYDAVASLRNETILLEPSKVNLRLCDSIDESNRKVEAMNPTSHMKAIKNPVEMENMRKAHVKDGIALTKFIYWIKNRQDGGVLMEAEAAEKLESFRKAQEGYLGPSFATISAYGANAAMCHYHATKEEQAQIGNRGFYLVDSGGQYYEGTTDVTRTIVMGGPLTDEERLHFTLVLMGMLRLSDAKFLYGCRGLNVDYLARGPLWKHGFDFNHGTGHGVGYLSSVHERPNGIRWKIVPERQDSCVLEEGMISSNEPGLYIEGSHGIRTENLLLCRKAEKNGYGQFMCFETLTFAPIDTEAIDFSVMEPSDIKLLNEYHKKVYEILSPGLTEEERAWLKEATREREGN